LQLYGVFKYLTVTTSPNTTRPSIFDVKNRAKWDAWNSVEGTYGEGGKADAEKRYLDIARSLGWVEGASITRKKSAESREADADLWDDEGTESRHGGDRMGKSVSAMVRPPEVADTSTIHSLSVSNDSDGLSSFLQEHPGTDVNERDQFVRIHLSQLTTF
jgi:acyl-CoA-binding protein